MKQNMEINRYFNTMEKVVDKELIFQLLKLKSAQQEKVLAYIKDLQIIDEMNRRAEQSEKEIAAGNTVSMNDFDKGFEQWIAKKRASI